MIKYDAVVVGAGNGGLAAATYLAKEGKKVLLCEKHNLPGGFATSFKRGRFEFEASLHELCGYGKTPGVGGTRKLLDYLGVSEKLDMRDVPAAFRVISIDKDENIDATLPFGRQAFIDKMEKYVPGCKESVEKLMDLADDIDKSMDAMDGDMGDMGKKELVGTFLNFARSAPYSAKEVFDALKIPKKAQDILSGYWSYLGTDLEQLSIIHYLSMVNSYINLGAVVPADRSHGLSSAFVEAFEEYGGDLWLNTEVTKINMKDGKVTGIVTADGTEVFTEHIICNCSPHSVYANMLPRGEYPSEEINAVNSRKFAPRGFSVFLGLNKSPEELGIKDHCYLIYDTMDTKKQFELMKNIETNNVQATVCLNEVIKDCSPEGTTILYFTSLFSDDCWGKVSPEDYIKTKRKFADKMIGNFEKYTGIKIRDAIEEIEIATPMTYARYTGTPQGSVYGYLMQDWDGVVTRTIMDNMGKNEKIPGLRFCGGFSTMGDGYSSAMTTGKNAAQRTLKDMEGGKK
ncbi:MAG: phytoene desaturase family protein [Acutalibacteraceae bacterium]